MLQTVITLFSAFVQPQPLTAEADDRGEFGKFSSMAELKLEELNCVAGGTDNGPRGSW